MVQELGKDGIQVVAGANERVIDAAASAAPANFHEEFLERLQVAVTQGAWIAKEMAQRLPKPTVE